MMSIGQASFPANNMTAPTAVRGKFAIDSPLEGAGFEPSVPPANEPQDSRTAEGDGDRSERLEGHSACQGTDGSNTAPSSEESVANLSPSIRGNCVATRSAACLEERRRGKPRGLLEEPQRMHRKFVSMNERELADILRRHGWEI